MTRARGAIQKKVSANEERIVMMHCVISFALVIKATCTTADRNHVTFTELVSAEGMGSREQKRRWLCGCALIGIFNELPSWQAGMRGRGVREECTAS